LFKCPEMTMLGADELLNLTLSLSCLCLFSFSGYLKQTSLSC